jgi:hypothetical protein
VTTIATRTLAGLVLLLALSTGAVMAQTPPGQNDSCHGANLSTCRPDPQPSHGHDCDHPNGNPIGNDDHCDDPLPTWVPTSHPIVTPPSINGPTITPPPTDTVADVVTESSLGFALLFLAGVLGLGTILLTVRRR